MVAVSVVYASIRGLLDKWNAAIRAVGSGLSRQDPVRPRWVPTLFTRIEAVLTLIILKGRQEIDFALIEAREDVPSSHLSQQLVVSQYGEEVVVVQIVYALGGWNGEGNIVPFHHFFQLIFVRFDFKTRKINAIVKIPEENNTVEWDVIDGITFLDGARCVRGVATK